MTEIANRKIDEKKYAHLLSKTLPRVITTEEENERMLELVNELISKPARTPEEDALFLLVCTLVEEFEDKAYPIPAAPPHTMLQFLMEQRGLRQKDLVHRFRSSGTISEVLSSKRAISKKQAKALGEYFSLPVDMFI
jgi:HTH-type transcriptional regulator/antitoxin HigA